MNLDTQKGRELSLFLEGEGGTDAMNDINNDGGLWREY